MSTHIDCIDALIEFHEKFGLGIRDYPGLISSKIVLLRTKLIITEAAELIEAMANGDLVKIADGITDLRYVTIGTGLEYGIPMRRVFNQVHANNMTKLGSDGKIIRDVAGKIQKPEGFKPVDLSWILDLKHSFEHRTRGKYEKSLQDI